MWIWHNYTWSESREIPIPASDRGLLHGFGIFDTMLAVDGELPCFAEHVARLAASCTRLGWPPPALATATFYELLKRNKLTTGRARIRVTLTAGSGEIHSTEQGEDFLLMLTAARANSRREAPASVIVSTFARNERSPLAGIKSTCYAENLLALSEARTQGHDEALLLNTQGHLCEGTTSNVFLNIADRWLTPPLSSGCLPGIARAAVLRAAAQSGAVISEETITREQVDSATAGFLSSAVVGIRAIGKIDGRMLMPPPANIFDLYPTP